MRARPRDDAAQLGLAHRRDLRVSNTPQMTSPKMTPALLASDRLAAGDDIGHHSKDPARRPSVEGHDVVEGRSEFRECSEDGAIAYEGTNRDRCMLSFYRQ